MLTLLFLTTHHYYKLGSATNLDSNLLLASWLALRESSVRVSIGYYTINGSKTTLGSCAYFSILSTGDDRPESGLMPVPCAAMRLLALFWSFRQCATARLVPNRLSVILDRTQGGPSSTGTLHFVSMLSNIQAATSFVRLQQSASSPLAIPTPHNRHLDTRALPRLCQEAWSPRGQRRVEQGSRGWIVTGSP